MGKVRREGVRKKKRERERERRGGRKEKGTYPQDKSMSE